MTKLYYQLYQEYDIRKIKKKRIKRNKEFIVGQSAILNDLAFDSK